MTKNMGLADRLIRTAVALIIGALYFTGRVGGTLGLVLMVFAVVFLLTSFLGWCPTYMPFGMSTRGRPPAGGSS